MHEWDKVWKRWPLYLMIMIIRLSCCHDAWFLFCWVCEWALPGLPSVYLLRDGPLDSHTALTWLCHAATEQKQQLLRSILDLRNATQQFWTNNKKGKSFKASDSHVFCWILHLNIHTSTVLSWLLINANTKLSTLWENWHSVKKMLIHRINFKKCWCTSWGKLWWNPWGRFCFLALSKICNSMITEEVTFYWPDTPNELHCNVPLNFILKKGMWYKYLVLWHNLKIYIYF